MLKLSGATGRATWVNPRSKYYMLVVIKGILLLIIKFFQKEVDHQTSSSDWTFNSLLVMMGRGKWLFCQK
jgi:hypothetical protein